MARIVILGGGFGGLTVAEKLAASLGIERNEITLISQSSEFIFYPGLMHVAFNNLEPDDIKFDLRAKLYDLDVRFVQGEILNIDTKHKAVKVYGSDFDGKVHYDYLIIAVGRRLATEKVHGFFENSHHLLSVKAALKFQKAVETFNRGHIVVGMCPDARLPVPVCETAFGLAKKFADKIAANKVLLSVIFPETIESAFGGAKIHREIEKAFKKHNIQIVQNFAVKNISRSQISDGEKSLDFDLLMMIPPFRGQSIGGGLGESMDESAYAKVNHLMQVEGLEHTYAIGDITALQGPKFASMAVHQAKVAAANITEEIKGEQPHTTYNNHVPQIIDEGGADAIYLLYGIWDESLYRLKSGPLCNWANYIHERYWKKTHF